MMNNLKFATQLRRIAEEIEEFVRNCVPAPVSEEDNASFAQKWANKLTEWAELAENQIGPITPDQRDRIGSNLFRGMGSFADFGLDQRKYGDSAKATNERLRKLTSELYLIFKE
jgi:hypothetical protein